MGQVRRGSKTTGAWAETRTLGLALSAPTRYGTSCVRTAAVSLYWSTGERNTGRMHEPVTG